jgi:hypothetical protein
MELLLTQAAFKLFSDSTSFFLIVCTRKGDEAISRACFLPLYARAARRRCLCQGHRLARLVCGGGRKHGVLTSFSFPRMKISRVPVL